MTNISIGASWLRDQVSMACGDVDNNLLMSELCIAHYRMYPTREANYVNNVVKGVVEASSYAKVSMQEANDNLPEISAAGAVHMSISAAHRAITEILTNQLTSVADNVIFSEYLDGMAVFSVS